MNGYKGRIAKWFSPRFIAWFKAFILFLIVYTAVALLLRYTMAYIVPFLLGLAIAFLSQPLIRFAIKHLKMKPSVTAWVSPLITILLLVGIIGYLGYLAVSELVSLVGSIPTIDPQAILTSVEAWIKSLKLPIDLPAFDMTFLNNNRDTILGALSQGLSYAGMAAKWAMVVVTSLPAWIMLIVVIIFSAFSFTKDFEKLKGYVWGIFSEHMLLSLRQTWANGLVMLGRYIRSYLLIYFLTFVESYVLFLALGIQYPLVWSLLAGIADLIPILGPGTIYLPLAIMRVIAGDWVTGLVLIGGWMLISVIRQFVESKVVADSINIHPLFMLAILFMAFQAGSLNVLIYLTFLLVFYNLLKQSGMLHPLFDSAEAKSGRKNRRLAFRKTGRNTMPKQTLESAPVAMASEAKESASPARDATGIETATLAAEAKAFESATLTAEAKAFEAAARAAEMKAFESAAFTADTRANESFPVTKEARASDAPQEK